MKNPLEYLSTIHMGVSTDDRTILRLSIQPGASVSECQGGEGRLASALRTEPEQRDGVEGEAVSGRPGCLFHCLPPTKEFVFVGIC